MPRCPDLAILVLTNRQTETIAPALAHVHKVITNLYHELHGPDNASVTYLHCIEVVQTIIAKLLSVELMRNSFNFVLMMLLK